MSGREKEITRDMGKVSPLVYVVGGRDEVRKKFRRG